MRFLLLLPLLFALVIPVYAEEEKPVESTKTEDSAKPEKSAKAEKSQKAGKAEKSKKTEESVKSEPIAEKETPSEEKAAEEPKKEEAPKEEPKKPAPESVELKHEPLKLTVKIPVMFEANKPQQVKLDAKEFADFKILEVVPHGRKVSAGETLVRFDAKKYEEALAEKERAFRLNEIGLKEEELSFKALQERTPILHEQMMLNKRYSDEDFAYYYNVLEALNDKLNEFMFRYAEFQVELAREELRQLEKMYASDDLVEETEEIILKRTRMSLEYSETFFESRKRSYERQKETFKAREDASFKRRAKLDEIDFQQRKETFPHALEKAKISLEKRCIAFEKEKESLEKFRNDKQFLTLKAPCNGIVYYGEYKDGKWNGAAQSAAKLMVDEQAAKGSVLMSVLELKPTRLRGTVPEKELHWVRVGTEGKAVPNANPDLKFSVKITELNEYPGVNNDYTAILEVDVQDSKIVPNMGGNVDLNVYDKRETILVPNSALKRDQDEEDSETHGYVFVLGENEETEKVKVKTGKTKGDKTEILEGVRVGQKILKTAKKEE